MFKKNPPIITALFAALFAALSAASSTLGCNSSPSAPIASTQPAPQQQPPKSKQDQQRADLEKIPPPVKSKYISIQTASNWDNPFIEVERDQLTVRIYLADANPTPTDQSATFLRPKAARRRNETIRVQDLGEMLSALPAGSWPYGRVAAVAESKEGARRDQAQVRRNVEQTMKILGDLGVVVQEWRD